MPDQLHKVNDCRSFFERNAENPEWVRALHAVEERREWENLSASHYSPGTVKSEEELCRILFDPIHIETSNSTLKPTAFADIWDKGLSVDRIEYRTLKDSIESGISQAATASKLRTPRIVHGYLIFMTSIIRSISHENEKCLGVFDTALPENASHADVCMILPGKEAFRSARAQLFELYKSELITI